MKHEELISKLWNLATPDPKQCNGCGYENSCTMRGCAIIREAIREIENLSALARNLERFAAKEKASSENADSDYLKGRASGTETAYGLCAKWIEEIIHGDKK